MVRPCHGSFSTGMARWPGAEWCLVSVKKSLFLTIVSLSLTGSALAYIDPGTGMSFVSGIGAYLAGLLAVAFGAIALTFKKWSAFVRSLFKKDDGDRTR